MAVDSGFLGGVRKLSDTAHYLHEYLDLANVSADTVITLE